MADEPAPPQRPMYTAADLGLDDDELAPCDLDPQLIQIDRVHYQRPLDPAKVGALLKAPEQMRQHHPVLVGVRHAGSLMCIDGQHRVTASMLLSDPSVPALVFPSDGWKHERDVYMAYQVWLQTAKPNRPMRLDAPRPEGAAA